MSAAQVRKPTIDVAELLAQIASRHAICLDAAERYKARGMDNVAMTERCAAFELAHLSDWVARQGMADLDAQNEAMNA